MEYEHSGRPQTFSFTAPTARSVQLVGDFTGWKSHPIPLHKGREGTWRATVALDPGQHRYRFLVDGEWRDDPDCQIRVANPYGTEDDIRQVTA